MKRMKQAFSPLPNNTIRFLVKGGGLGTAETFQTTTISEFKIISSLLQGQLPRRSNGTSKNSTTAQSQADFSQEAQEAASAAARCI